MAAAAKYLIAASRLSFSVVSMKTSAAKTFLPQIVLHIFALLTVRERKNVVRLPVMILSIWLNIGMTLLGGDKKMKTKKLGPKIELTNLEDTICENLGVAWQKVRRYTAIGTIAIALGTGCGPEPCKMPSPVSVPPSSDPCHDYNYWNGQYYQGNDNCTDGKECVCEKPDDDECGCKCEQPYEYHEPVDKGY
jgi:hypothetical protein